MTLTNIKEGDIVECDRKGQRFHAKVEEKIKGGLRIKPLTRQVTWREVTASQVVVHYRRSKMSLA